MGRRDAPLIGREKETAFLEQAIAESRRGRRRAVKILGEPGMGKTTLLQWTYDRCIQEGLLCARAKSPATGSLPSGYLLNELLGGLVHACANRSRTASESSHSLSRSDSLHSVGSHSAPNLLQVAETLTQVSDHGTLALFLDDLQWAHDEDVASLFASFKMVDSPLLVVIAERRQATRRRPHPMPDISAELPVSRLLIKGLDSIAVAELAEKTIGAPVLPSLTRELTGRTLGNPLFVNETLQTWMSTGVVVPL
ncbi:MAG: AAA family ATPase, partial [Actinomycetota bacterium]